MQFTWLPETLLQQNTSEHLLSAIMFIPQPLVILTDILKFFLDEQTTHSAQTTNEQFYSDVIIPLMPHTNLQQGLCKRNTQWNLLYADFNIMRGVYLSYMFTDLFFNG